MSDKPPANRQQEQTRRAASNAADIAAAADLTRHILGKGFTTPFAYSEQWNKTLARSSLCVRPRPQRRWRQEARSA